MSRARSAAFLVPVLILLGALVWLLSRGSEAPSTAAAPAAGAARTAAERAAAPDALAPAEDERGAGAAPREELTERAPAALDAEEEAGWELTEALELAGRVLLPPGTPADERLLVLAFSERRSEQQLYYEDGPVERAWDPERGPRAPLLSKAEVDTDGRFVVPVPAGRKEVHLALTGRYVYSRATVPVRLDGDDSPVLTGLLGGCIAGLVVDGVEAAGAISLDDLEVELGPDISAGFDAREMGARATTRHARTDAEGRFEFRALPAGLAAGIFAQHPERGAALELGLRPVPGELLTPTLRLGRGVGLSGRVVDEAGGPLAEVVVAARWRGALGAAIGSLRSATTGADGAFDLRGVAAGKIELEALRDGLLPVRHVVEPQPEDGARVSGLALVLERGGTLAGVVRYPDGAPAAGADLRAAPDLSSVQGFEAMSLARDRGASGKTGADGRFELSGLGTRAYTLRASLEVDEGEHAGDWTARVPGVRAGAAAVEVTLDELCELPGRVVDLTGEPLNAFRVQTTLVGSGMAFDIGAELRSQPFEEAEDGRFVVTGLNAGAWKVRVGAPGFALSEEQEIVLPVPAGAPAPEFALAPAAEVRGVVLDSGGAPVVGASVGLELGALQRTMRQVAGDLPAAISGAEGRFVLQGLEPGEHSLVASLEGFAPSEPEPVSVLPGGLLEDVALRLRVGGRLLGEVLGEEGQPDAGATVIVQRLPDYGEQHFARSASDGTFTIEHMAPGKWQVVCTPDLFGGGLEVADGEAEAAMGDFLSSLKMDMVEIIDGEDTHVVLGAEAGEPVRVGGRVRHGEGPVPNAAVTFVPEDSSGLGSLKIAMTDAAGRYSVELDHPGTWLVTVQTSLGDTRQNSVEYLEHVPDDVEEHTLDFLLPMGRISGRVLGPDGEPVEGCRVTLHVEDGIAYGSLLGGQYAELATDAGGRYEIPYLRPGRYAVAAGGAPLGGIFGLDAQHGGRVVESGLRIAAGEWLEHVDFRLEEPGDLRGFVRGADGRPRAGATVYVRDERGRPLERFSLVNTDGAGRFVYKGLAPGRYTASARAEGLACEDAAPVSVPSGGSGEVVLTLAPATMVVVRVTDRSDAELRARVQVLDSEERDVSGLRSLSNVMESFGQGFSSKEQRLGPFPPGRYEVIATLEDGRSDARPVRLNGQAERKVNLRID